MDQPIPKTATAAIELHLAGQALEGALTAADGRAHRFSGWIELATVIEDWRVEAASGQVPQGALADGAGDPRTDGEMTEGAL